MFAGAGLTGREREVPQRAGALDAERQGSRRATDHLGPGRPKHPPRRRFPPFHPMPRVSGPQLVAAVPRQGDSHVLACGL